MKEVDHKKIGRDLGLFTFSRKVPGTTYWWPKGNLLFNLIIDDLKKRLDKQGYRDIKTPAVISTDTLKQSGHYDNYREKLFFTGNEKELKNPRWCLKPMNCPGSIILFNQEMRSYKDLPLKFSEIETVYRYEQPGEVNGLFRTRAITIDDAHIYCTEEQIKEEIVKLMDFTQKTYKHYGFSDIKVEFSTRPEKSIGTNEQWEKAEEGLKSALKSEKLTYKENKGEGAFYGPKIDFHIKDSLGRSWQMGTIQLDFSMAERLNANYIDEKGKKQTPIIIHRAILGSVERFIAVLLEHTNGALPLWLSPIQVKIIPVADRHNKYAEEIVDELMSGRVDELRVEIDSQNETVSKKIRAAELEKVPYILVVGDKEKKKNQVTVRKRGSKKLETVDLTSFLKNITKETEGAK